MRCRVELNEAYRQDVEKMREEFGDYSSMVFVWDIICKEIFDSEEHARDYLILRIGSCDMVKFMEIRE